MTCQIILSDYVIERRMVFLLDANDFAAQHARWQESDHLLDSFQSHPFFQNCQHWCDLSLAQFHTLIINMITISAQHSELEIANKEHPTIMRLTFFLCALVTVLQKSTGSVIDLLRVNRIGPTDVLYDYSARLDIAITPPKATLRVVIDNK
jgi:hypothetical protein